MTGGTESGAPDARTPGLPRRLLDAFFSPGAMATAVARDPRWIGALLVSLVLVAISTALIPPELFAEAQRRAALESGATVPPMTDRTLQLIRVFSIVGGPLAITIITFVFAGLYTVVFAFVLGDEGRYRQYLAMLTHAGIIPSLLSLGLVPLRISTANAQFTLNLGSLLPFLPDGYLASTLALIDLTQIWSSLVVAQGLHAIDRRRSFGSAAAILLGFLVVVALILARFIPT